MTNKNSNATVEGRKKATATIKAKAQNNVYTLAVIPEVLKLVSVEDIKRAYGSQYVCINYTAIAQYLKYNNFLTPSGTSNNWTQAQVKRIIERIYNENK